MPPSAKLGACRVVQAVLLAGKFPILLAVWASVLVVGPTVYTVQMELMAAIARDSVN